MRTPRQQGPHPLALEPLSPLPPTGAPYFHPPPSQRYSALFALRNKGGAEAVCVLGEVFSTCSSALLKHEVRQEQAAVCWCRVSL